MITVLDSASLAVNGFAEKMRLYPVMGSQCVLTVLTGTDGQSVTIAEGLFIIQIGVDMVIIATIV